MPHNRQCWWRAKMGAALTRWVSVAFVGNLYETNPGRTNAAQPKNVFEVHLSTIGQHLPGGEYLRQKKRTNRAGELRTRPHVVAIVARCLNLFLKISMRQRMEAPRPSGPLLHLYETYNHKGCRPGMEHPRAYHKISQGNTKSNVARGSTRAYQFYRDRICISSSPSSRTNRVDELPTIVTGRQRFSPQ